MSYFTLLKCIKFHGFKYKPGVHVQAEIINEPCDYIYSVFLKP